MRFQCPVCAYSNMRHPPVDFAICPCCGTQFGYDDAGQSYDELRQAWIDSGAQWFSPFTQPQAGWNGYSQLLRAGLALIPIAESDDTDQTESWGTFVMAADA